jgi:DNA-binding XRE family transcriptional regulator
MALPDFTAPTSLPFEELVERATDLAESDEALMYALVAARRAAGLSQRAVADFLGIKQPTVARFERHDSDPRLSTIRRYALAIGAHVHHDVVPAEDAFDPLKAWQDSGARTLTGSYAGVAGVTSERGADDVAGVGSEYISVAKTHGLAA